MGHISIGSFYTIQTWAGLTIVISYVGELTEKRYFILYVYTLLASVKKQLGSMAQSIDKYREHSGTILKNRFLDPFRLTTQSVSRATSIDEMLLNQIIEGNLEIDPDTGLKLANYFGLSDDYFFRIKRVHDLS